MTETTYTEVQGYRVRCERDTDTMDERSRNRPIINPDIAIPHAGGPKRPYDRVIEDPAEPNMVQRDTLHVVTSDPDVIEMETDEFVYITRGVRFRKIAGHYQILEDGEWCYSGTHYRMHSSKQTPRPPYETINGVNYAVANKHLEPNMVKLNPCDDPTDILGHVRYVELAEKLYGFKGVRTTQTDTASADAEEAKIDDLPEDMGGM